MTVTLSGVIIGMVLLVGLPIGLISVRLEQQEAARQRQEMANRAARHLANMLQGLQTNQLQVTLTQISNANLSYITSQLSTTVNLTIARVSAQIQEALTQEIPPESLFERNPQIQSLQIFNADGTMRQNHWRDTPLIAKTISPSRETQILMEQGLSTQDDFMFTADNTPLLSIATPIVVEGQTNGYALAWVTVPSLWAYLTDLQVGRTGYVYVIDEANRLVAAPSRFGDAEQPGSAMPKVGQGVYVGLNGERVVGQTAPIEDTAWQVVAEIPLTEANAGLRSLLIILLAILLFGISVAIWVARLFSHWLLRPIYTLQTSATQISQGDLSHRIELQREDELGFLAHAFNQMVGKLEQTINELRNVSLNILSAQETERRRIAHVIHDELGQMLTALRLNLWMSMQTQPDNEALATAHRQATEVQEMARTLSHELRPAMLDELGLVATLEWYIDRIEQRANLAIVFDPEIDEADLPAAIKTALYRLITEALTNITRHAQASVVEILLVAQNDSLILTVVDDGHGFDTRLLERTSSLGIIGMRERVNLLGGDFLLKSKIGEGTYIAVTLPLQIANGETETEQID